MTNKLMNMDEIADRYFDLEMATDEIFMDMVNRWNEFTETDRKLVCKALAEQMNEYALYKILDGLSYDLDVAEQEKEQEEQEHYRKKEDIKRCVCNLIDRI